MTHGVKPPPDRLYGRARGPTLRPRQRALLEQALPRLAFALADASAPARAFHNQLSELWLEVGFGGGEHALELVRANPHAGLIACEVYENGICSMLSALVPDGDPATAPLPANLRLFPDDARPLIHALPDRALARMFLMFPDPWPKARHAKRRFVHPALLGEVARVLRPGAEWRIASDHPVYQQWVAEVFAPQMLFNVSGPMTARPEGWPGTRYEAKAMREGRVPMYWRMIRRA